MSRLPVAYYLMADAAKSRYLLRIFHQEGLWRAEGRRPRNVGSRDVSGLDSTPCFCFRSNVLSDASQSSATSVAFPHAFNFSQGADQWPAISHMHLATHYMGYSIPHSLYMTGDVTRKL
jgi:hypothetical protein